MQTHPDHNEAWQEPAPQTATVLSKHFGSWGKDEHPPPLTVARTEQEPFDLTQIPWESERRVAAVFAEGDRKYQNRHWSTDGHTLLHGNWLQGAGNRRYQLERANHALKHLKIAIHRLEFGEDLGEPGEDHLAKTAWFCLTQMELERLEQKQGVTHG